MTYEELQKIAEDNGYEITNEIDYVILTKYEEDNIIKISRLKEDIIFSTMYACMKSDFQMLKVSLEFAETPLEDRYPENKYYLKHRFMCGFEKCTFFNIDNLNKALYLSDKKQTQNIQTQFTQKEIDEIKEKYDTTLEDFEQIEVEK